MNNDNTETEGQNATSNRTGKRSRNRENKKGRNARAEKQESAPWRDCNERKNKDEEDPRANHDPRQCAITPQGSHRGYFTASTPTKGSNT